MLTARDSNTSLRRQPSRQASLRAPLLSASMEVWVDRRAEWSTCITRCGATNATFFTTRPARLNRQQSRRGTSVSGKHRQPRRSETTCLKKCWANDRRPHVRRRRRPSGVTRIRAGLLGADYTVENGRTVRRFMTERTGSQIECAPDAAGSQRRRRRVSAGGAGRDVRPPATYTVSSRKPRKIDSDRWTGFRRRQFARGHRGACRRRAGAAQFRLDREQPPQSGSVSGGRVGYVICRTPQRRLREFQSLFLQPGGRKA